MCHKRGAEWAEKQAQFNSKLGTKMTLLDVICIKTTSALPLRLGSKRFKGKKKKKGLGLNLSHASTIFTSMAFPYFLQLSCRILRVSSNSDTFKHPSSLCDPSDPRPRLTFCLLRIFIA